MSSSNAHTGQRGYVTARRVSTETKASVKTTELIAYVVAVIAVIVASQVA
ncbi:MAG: hypothetical protein JWN22_1588, partial [Nocardioides sp.]|nr:hypothetical protein [Nocardioides sp.]